MKLLVAGIGMLALTVFVAVVALIVLYLTGAFTGDGGWCPEGSPPDMVCARPGGLDD